jgi:hypothetical protein
MEDPADRKRFEEIDARLAAARPPGPPYREVYAEIRDAVVEFRDGLVGKYRDYHGRDWTKQISHLMGQLGFDLHVRMELEKQARRQEKREARIAQDKAQEGEKE